MREDNKNVRRRRSDLAAPVFRSPVLKKQTRLTRTANEGLAAKDQGLTKRRSGGAVRYQSVRYAAEDQISGVVAPQKKLPDMRARLSSARLPAVPALTKRHLGQTGYLQERAATSLPRIVSHSSRPLLPSSMEVMSEDEQRKLADLEMRLPRVARKIDSVLLLTILALLCIGLVMVYSASSFVAARAYNDPSYFFQKQLLGALLGGAAMFVTARVDYRRWRRYSLLGMLIVFPLLIIVLKFGTNAYGASRWLSLGPFLSFQPSEFAKLVLALYIADWLARKGNQVETFWYGLAPFVILVGAILGLVLLENDMGTAIVIAGLAMVMFFTAGANIFQFLLAMSAGGLVFVIQAFHGYRYYRLLGFLNPFEYTTSLNLQLYQSLLALGSGGWLGLGLGASRQKTGYIPFPHIDSIFAILGEELGFFGCAIVIGLFLLLAFRGFRLARRTQDIYGALLATGITTWLVLQAMVNIGSSSGSIPYTGVPLPFISYGGTSMVISMAAVGVLLNISRYIREPEDPALSRYTITRTFKKKA